MRDWIILTSFTSYCAVDISCDIEIVTFRNVFVYTKNKFSKGKIAYYSNTTETFNVILKSGDVELNPGPGSHKPKSVMSVKKLSDVIKSDMSASLVLM